MQPKFTLKNLGFVGLRFFAIAMIIGLTTQFSFSQERPSRFPKVTAQQQAERETQKLERHNAKQILSMSDNDAGLPNRTPNLVNPNRTEAVCTTWNVSITSADPTTTQRGWRDGIPKTCAAPLSCTAGLAGTFNYQIFQWVNPANQCVTVNYTGTNASFGFVTVHNAPPTIGNTCANWVADPGSSATNGGTITFSFNGTAGTTYYFFVTNVGATPSNCTIEIDAPVCSSVPCTGTPAPGNTMSSATTACPGINFNLSLENPTPGAGVSYVWESGPSMTGPWTVIAGATNSTLSRNQSAATYYRSNVTCGGNTGTSTPVLVALTPPSSCYCIPPAVDCTDDDEIIRVQISTLDNASACSTGPPAGYGDYTTSVAAPNVQAGAPNMITVSYKTIWSKSGAVWIDYNQNGQFEVNEYTSTGSGAGTVAQLMANINIPGTALPGVTRMRVRSRFGTAGFLPTQACTNPSGFGETEDYNVNILPCVPVVITASPVNRTIQCSGTTTFSTTTTGTNPTFQWEYRPNAATPWQFVTDGGIYSGASTSTLTVDNVSQAFNGYQYRAVVLGGCSATDFSGFATLTVGPLIATVSPTSANICTGSIQQLTLTNASSPTTVSFASPAALGLALPDGNVAGANHSINVSGIPAGSVVTRVDVKMNVTHGWVADLEVVLKAPNGQVLNLSDLVSGTNQSGANFINTVFSTAGVNAISTGTRPGYTGIFKADAIPGPTGAFGVPAGPTGFLPTTTTWSALYTGGTLNGNWTLAMYDAGPPDPGVFNNWTITLTYGAPATGVWTSSPATPNTMFTNATATTPYVAGAQATTIWVKPTVNTNYSVVYSTATPCTSPATVIPVNVFNPISAVADPANRSVCIGGTTSFTSATATGGPFTRQWQVSTNSGLTYTNISSATSATLTLTGVTQLMNNNLYRVGYTAAPCIGTTYSNAAKLTVNPLPVVVITAPDLALTPPSNGNTVITGTSNPAAAAGGWAWTLNGASISGTTNTQSVGIDRIGTYQATVTDINGCVSKSNSLVIGSESSDRLWIYPNPTTGQFQVRLYYDSDVTERRRVTIFNMLGQVITSKHFTLANNTAPYLRMDFDLTNMQRGTYLIKVAHEFTGKVVSGFLLVQ